MSTPTPPKKPSTASSTRHSTGSVLVARPSAPQTPATYRPWAGRTSFSRSKVGPSGAPNHGGGPGGACPGPGGGGGGGGGGASADVAPAGGIGAVGGSSAAGGAEGAGASCDGPAVVVAERCAAGARSSGRRGESGLRGSS